jgi:hypothetical protein
MMAHADDSWAWSHAGTSFALQTISYGISEQLLGIGKHRDCNYDYYYGQCAYRTKGQYNRTEAVVFSAAITFMATFAYSYAKTLKGAPLPTGEILMNSIGQGAAIGAIYAFHF